MLILFDVDATLITTSKAGIRAMGLAGRERFGDTFDEHTVEYAGRLDPLIIADLLTAHDQPATPQGITDFAAAYKHHLHRLLTDDPTLAGPCPGVPELLDALEAIDEVTLGLLTGNMPDTGAIKLNACGIDLERFAVRVWGSDSPHDPPAREHLPAIGIERYLQLHGTPIQQDRVTIIGDTPHDIACARAHDCRVLAVATGSYTIDDLAHADRAVDDLSDTQEILRWLTSPATVR